MSLVVYVDFSEAVDAINYKCSTSVVLKLHRTPRSSNESDSLAPTAPARAALNHCARVDTVTQVPTVRLALLLRLVEVCLVVDGGAAVFRDLLIGLA